ncbi:MAG: ISAs1 family transposase, partial [Vallitaleaceae bacterium]|nr:ISAs1 family transposase [Vallitaleaceae bacterium]
MDRDMTDLIKIFERIPDERQTGKIKHLLCDVIFIAIIATVASCDDYEEIEEYAVENKDWFKKYLKLPNGIPSHDTIERVFSWINPKLVTSCFADWTSLISKTSIPIKIGDNEGKSKEQGIIAIDGKTMKATKDEVHGKKAMHVVSAWFSENKMVLGQVQTGEKSNEITAIPELLKILDITGNIITIDAIGTQTKIAKAIVAKKADYVLAVKGNHDSLHGPIVEFFNELNGELIKDYNILHYQETDKGHGRIESRDFYITDQIKWLEPNSKWSKLTSIGMVVYKSIKNEKENTEVRYFISSIAANAELF